MRYTLILIGILVVGLGGWYALRGSGASQVTAPGGRAEAPSASPSGALTLTLKDYAGNEVNLAQQGKPLVVNSWASWCPFCRQELPDFATLQKEFPGIAVIAIDRQESLSTAQQYSDQLGVTGKLTLLLDPSDSFYKAIGGFSMPETIFVDRGGAIVFHKRGPLTIEEMRQKLSDLKLAP